jgi:hypothetical protein
LTETPIPPHLDESLDFSRYGGRQRIFETLDEAEEIQHASHGWLEEVLATQNRGKRREGLLLVTDRRVLFIRRPSLLRKNPRSVSIPFETISNAGQHKSIPNQVVVTGGESRVAVGYYLALPTDEAHDATAVVWGATILEGASAAGGTQ